MELLGNQVEPVSWRSAKAIECLLEAPVGVWFGDRTVGWRTDDSRFVVGEFRVTESIFTIGLL